MVEEIKELKERLEKAESERRAAVDGLAIIQNLLQTTMTSRKRSREEDDGEENEGDLEIMERVLAVVSQKCCDTVMHRDTVMHSDTGTVMYSDTGTVIQ